MDRPFYLTGTTKAPALKFFALFPLLLLLSHRTGLSAQEHAVERVNTLAAALELEGVLSTSGADYLRDRADIGLRLPFPYHRFTRRSVGRSSRAGLLGELASLFKSAYYYRKGFDLPFRLHNSGTDINDLDSLAYADLMRRADERLQLRAGYQTELARAAETDMVLDSSRVTRGRVSFGMLNPLSDQAIPTERSVSGYEVLSTLSVLSDLDIIEADTFNKYRQRLEQEGYVPDYLLLDELAMHYAIQETEEERSRQRGVALDFFLKNNMISGTDYRRLHSDSTFLRGTSRFDFLRVLRPGIQLVVHRPQGIDAFMATLSDTLCHLNDELCGLRYRMHTDRSSSQRLLTLSHRDRDSTIVLGRPAAGANELYYLKGQLINNILALPNERLETTNAPYRLYVSMDTDLYGQQDPDSVEVVLHPFPSRMARMSRGPALRNVLSHFYGPAPDSYLSSAEVDTLTDTFTRMGVFDGLDKPALTEGLQCLDKKTTAGLAGYFRCFPRLYLPTSPTNIQQVRDGTSVLDQLPGKSYYHDSVWPGESLLLRLPHQAAEYVEEHFPMWLGTFH